MIRFSLLCGKEVICVKDGARLGYINDLEFDPGCGRIIAFLLPDNRFLNFSRKPRFRVCFEDIEQVSADLILVCRYECLEEGKKRKKDC